MDWAALGCFGVLGLLWTALDCLGLLWSAVGCLGCLGCFEMLWACLKEQS